jgi:hypothetical protein
MSKQDDEMVKNEVCIYKEIGCYVPTLRFTLKFFGIELDRSANASTLTALNGLPDFQTPPNPYQIVMLKSFLYNMNNEKVGIIYYTCSVFGSYWICNGTLDLTNKGTIQYSFQFTPIQGTIIVPPQIIRSEIIAGSGRYFGKKGYLSVNFKESEGKRGRIVQVYF